MDDKYYYEVIVATMDGNKIKHIGATYQRELWERHSFEDICHYADIIKNTYDNKYEVMVIKVREGTSGFKVVYKARALSGYLFVHWGLHSCYIPGTPIPL